MLCRDGFLNVLKAFHKFIKSIDRNGDALFGRLHLAASQFVVDPDIDQLSAPILLQGKPEFLLRVLFHRCNESVSQCFPPYINILFFVSRLIAQATSQVGSPASMRAAISASSRLNPPSYSMIAARSSNSSRSSSGQSFGSVGEVEARTRKA